jgi:signal transduction histidine kinase
VTTAAWAGWLAAFVGCALAAAALLWRRRTVDAVARASHELRGPITAARLGLTLASRLGELSPSRFNAIEGELEQAALALDDLAAAPGRSPSARREGPLDVAELVKRSVEAWAAVARERGTCLELATSASEFVWGERVRLGQAIGNLIANAIEHGGDEVAVACHRAGALIRIQVSDNGPGLPAPVAQLAREARRGRGWRGRGLAIALAVAEAHGGRIASAPAERGAKLVLELPAAEDWSSFAAAHQRDDGSS